MDYVLLTPSPRWQITLPKKVREKIRGFRPGEPVRVYADQGKIVVEPMADSLTIKPKYTPEEYKKILAKYENDGKVYWTKEDDEYLAKLRKKDDKYLNW